MNLPLMFRPEYLLLAATLGPVIPHFDSTTAGAESPTAPAPVYEQKLYRAEDGADASVDADDIVRRFRGGYSRLGSPRFLIYVNRELVDTRSGFKLAGREETVVSNHREASRELTSVQADIPEVATSGRTGTNSQGPSRPVEVAPSIPAGGSGDPIERSGEGVDAAAPVPRASVSSVDRKVAGVNRYERVDREEDSFEYRRMSRELEQVFGRRLRAAGALVADQKVATALIADRPLRDFAVPSEGEQARKDRQALARVADVVIEILIADRSVTVARVSGPVERSVPEIFATAVRLSDARVMGQAASSALLGSQQERARAMKHDVRSIADATVLQLMEELLLGLHP